MEVDAFQSVGVTTDIYKEEIDGDYFITFTFETSIPTGSLTEEFERYSRVVREILDKAPLSTQKTLP